MSKRNKLLRWLNDRTSKSQPARYRTLSHISSDLAPSEYDFSSEDDNFYEDIENYAAGGIQQDYPEYNLYLRQYFFALRDSHINRHRSNDTDEMPSVSEVPPVNVVGEDSDQYRFPETELMNRPRGTVCSSNRPRICICRCETIFRRPTIPPRSYAWDAGWVFCSGDRDMRKLARRSSERVKDTLFEGGD